MDASPGRLVACGEFLRPGRLDAPNLDYDVPFIPVVMVIPPIPIGMRVPLSWFTGRVSRRERRRCRVGSPPTAPGP